MRRVGFVLVVFYLATTAAPNATNGGWHLSGEGANPFLSRSRSIAPVHAQRARSTTKKPAAPKPVPKTEPADVKCPEPLGTGLKTKASFCFVLAGRDPSEGVLVSIPPHSQATLTFDLHNRHTYSDEESGRAEGSPNTPPSSASCR